MKWILALLLFVSASAICQVDDTTKYISYPAQYGMKMPRIWAPTTMIMPYGDTTGKRPGKIGAFMTHTGDGNVYRWNGSDWVAFGGSSLTASNGLTKIGDTIKLGGVLTGTTHISGGVNAHPFVIDSSASISLFSGLEFVSSGIGSSIQLSDSVMNIGSSSATDFTSFVFSPTRIKFTAADGAGSNGDVWTNTGSGYGHWAPPTSGISSLTNTGTGYSLVTTPNGSIKRLFPGYGVLFDSTTTANSITARVDTSGVNPVVTTSALNDAIAGAGGTVCQISYTLDGTDISATLQSLINSGCKNIVLPRGKFIIGTTVQMSDSVMISGEGKATVIELTKNIPAFKCSWSGGGNKSTFKDFSFLGTYPQDSTSQDGILSDSCNGILTHNISAMKLGGWAIHFKNNGFCCSGYPLPTGVIGNLTSDCFIDSCYGGVFHDTRGEFNSVVNTTVVRGKYGVYTSAGSSRIEACNLSGTDYGVVITGGPNNAHGTMIGTHIAHNRRMGLYVTGASNGYEITGCNIRQDSILIENSDNIRFTACELGALDDAIVVTNSTNTIFSFNRVWGSNPFGEVSAGTKMITADSTTNGISLVDLVNGKRFDVTQTNGLVDFTGNGIRRIRMVNDTLNFSTSGTRHIIAGGENSIDSLHITSTTSASKGRIKFGFNNGFVFNESSGNLGLGTSNPNNAIDIFGAGVKNINVQFSDATGHARMTFNGVNGSAGAQFLFGNSTSPFVPDGFLISSLTGSLALANQNGDIRFTKSTTINGSNEHARFTNDGSFLFGVTTNDPTKGRFQIKSRSRFDSLMHLNNVPAPPGAYNFLVHSTTDSGLYQIPVSSIAGITSINSHTGPSITVSGGTATSIDNSIPNTVAVNVTPSSNALPHTLDAVYTTAGNTGTGETDLYSYSVPANKLAIDGRTANFEIDGEFNDNTATAQLKLYFAGNVTLNTGAVNISTAFTGWRLKGYIMRTSSSTAHVTYELHCPGLATPQFIGYSNLTSLDFTTTNVFKITAQAGGAGGGNSDITAHSWQILYKPQPQ